MNILMICSLVSASVIFQTAKTPNLDAHNWNNRILVILVDEVYSADYQKQLRILSEDLYGLDERKLLIYTITPEQFRRDFREDSTWILSKTRYADLKQSNDPFELILIGLDGGVKLRQNEPISLQDLYVRIDNMPMRRAELRRNAAID